MTSLCQPAAARPRDRGGDAIVVARKLTEDTEDTA